MKIDIIIYGKNEKEVQKFNSYYRVEEIKAKVKELTGYEPKVYYDFEQVDSKKFYFLFYAFVYQSVDDFAPYSANMIYMDGLWNDLDVLSEQFSYLGIVHRPYFIDNRPYLFAPKAIVNKINNQFDSKYLINPKTQAVGDADVFLIKGNQEEDLIAFLVDYLKYYVETKGT